MNKIELFFYKLNELKNTMSKIFVIDLDNKEHYLIDSVINSNYRRFNNSNVPIYDQLLSLVVNEQISKESIQYCLNSYLELHSYHGCDLLSEVAFIHWNNVPQYCRCNMCNKIMNLDYVNEICKTCRYPSTHIYNTSALNLKKLQQF
jgi:Zn finger protein HypA/HybF involved in hydrogenase expression